MSSGYAQAVVEFVQDRGWDTSVTTVREGVSIVSGRREGDDGVSRVLTLVVEEPESQVSTDHVEYLLRVGRSENADNVLLTATVPVSEDATRTAREYGVDVLDPDRVSPGSDGAGSPGSGRTLLTRRRLLLGGVVLGGALLVGGGYGGPILDAGSDRTSSPETEAGTATPVPTPASARTPTPATARTASPTTTPTPTFRGERYSTVFLGNSYTASHDLPGLYHSSLRRSGSYETRPLTTRSVTAGGRRLHEHVDELESGGDVAAVLGGEDPPWDTVVLQEQSQIPGFSPGHPERERSIEAAVALAEAATRHGAGTVLFMTWGRRTGDEMNPELYPDFETMQRRLAEGYRAMADSIEAAGHSVAIAPVGLGFRAVYDTVAATGTDPATEGTAFWELYSGDGSHPSLQGSYLAALVIAGTATDVSPSAVPYVPDPVGNERASLLRDAAATALEA